jgi:hypothetical protein
MNTDILEKNINEEIDGREAKTEKGSLKTLLSGQRNVAFVPINEKLRRLLEKRGYRIILVRRHDIDKFSWWSIVYNNAGNEYAHKLYKIAQGKHGYLTDRTPDEAKEIGKLLGYSEKSIKDFVYGKYGRKPPLIDDNPDNYDDLHEEKSDSQLNKKIVEVVKDEDGNDVKICTVNGKFVKGTNPGLGFIQFVEGGHHYVDSYPGYKKYIPEDEIWVDEVFFETPDNFKGIVGHEWKERNNIKYHKMNYDDAHDLSNTAEKKFRGEKKKLNESYQFQKTVDLMNKVSVM